VLRQRLPQLGLGGQLIEHDKELIEHSLRIEIGPGLGQLLELTSKMEDDVGPAVGAGPLQNLEPLSLPCGLLERDLTGPFRLPIAGAPQVQLGIGRFEIPQGGSDQMDARGYKGFRQVTSEGLGYPATRGVTGRFIGPVELVEVAVAEAVAQDVLRLSPGKIVPGSTLQGVTDF